MEIIILGSGTSQGIPVIGCNCRVCHSANAKDKRTRSSIFVKETKQNCSSVNTNGILIDCGPEFRIQAIRENISKIDAVFLTHSHADHIAGLDDLRSFANTKQHLSPMQIFSLPITLTNIKKRFDYLFMQTQIGGGKLNCTLHNIENYTKEKPVKFGNLKITGVPMKHGNLDTCGYLFRENVCIEQNKTSNKISYKSLAYLTDCNYLSETSIDLVKNVDILIIDSLREMPHETHFCFNETYTVAKKIGAKKTYVTHLTHNLTHDEVNEYFINLSNKDKSNLVIKAAFDGQRLFL
ncbi:MAG: MBL fold metallo-hydrolase [Treponema sp.]|nr:MBL fold metallo-hydrolase [Treponema sp.]